MTDQDISQICQKLSILDGRLDAIEQQMVALNERCPIHFKQIREHYLTLHGLPENGRKPGLIGRVANLESNVQLYNWGLRAAWGIIAALIITLLTIAIFGRVG